MSLGDLLTEPLADLDILREIADLASSTPGDSSFTPVWSAYNTVLKAHRIDTAYDGVYFPLIMKLLKAEGDTYKDKLQSILKQLAGTIETSTSASVFETPRRKEAHQPRRQAHTDPNPSMRTHYAYSETSPTVDYRTPPLGANGFATPPHRILPENLAVARTSYSVRPVSEGMHAYRKQLLEEFIKSKLRRYLYLWRHSARRLSTYHARQDRLALRHDRRTLMLQSLAIWHDKHAFYMMMARKTVKARNLLLLERCFAWWKQRTQTSLEQRERMRDALLVRRHLRAWKHIVERDNEKALQFRLKSVWSKWHRKASALRGKQSSALTKYKHDLVKRAWRAWFYKACANRATVYHNVKIGRELLALWISRTRDVACKTRRSQRYYKNTLAAAVLDRWRSRTLEVTKMSAEADEVSAVSTARAALHTWSYTARLQKNLHVIRRNLDDNLQAAAFVTWKDRRRDVQVATTFAYQSLLRMTFTAWLSEARANKVLEGSEDRLMRHAIQKLSLFARLRSFERHRDQHLVMRAFGSWLDRVRITHEYTDLMCRTLQRKLNKKLKEEVLATWQDKYEEGRRREAVAYSRYSASIAKNAFSQWRSSFEEKKKYREMADHASQYFIFKKYLQIWQEVQETTVRNRRAEQALAAKDHHEGRLMRSALQSWTTKIILLREMQREACDKETSMNSALCGKLLTRWRDKLEYVREADARAELTSERHLKTAVFKTWKETFDKLQELEAIANEQSLSRDLAACKISLRSWGMLLFRIRGATEQAERFAARRDHILLGVMWRLWRKKLRPGHDTTILTDGTSEGSVASTPTRRGNGLNPARSLLEDAFATGKSVTIFTGSGELLQTLASDDEIRAVELDCRSGRIAIANTRVIVVYSVTHTTGRDFEWRYERELVVHDDSVTALSWGVDGELLVAGRTLRLWSPNDAGPTGLLWNQALANPVYIASFSPDAFLVASVGLYDRLVKIWRRSTIHGPEPPSYDYTYLPHPCPVTSLKWRRPFHEEQSIDNVLYTIGEDDVLRIWTPTNALESHNLHLWRSIDLRRRSGEADASNGEEVAETYCVLIDNADLVMAIESALTFTNETHAGWANLQQLISTAQRNPEICIAMSARGSIAAWALENVGSKSQNEHAMVELFHFDEDSLALPFTGGLVQLVAFSSDRSGEKDMTIVAHDYTGQIYSFHTNIGQLLAQKPIENRITLTHKWTGHVNTIKTLARTINGRALLTWDGENEAITWSYHVGRTMELILMSCVPSSAPDALVVLHDGLYTLSVENGNAILWDCSRSDQKGQACSKCALPFKEKTVCLFALPEGEGRSFEYTSHILGISNKNECFVLTVSLPEQTGHAQSGTSEASVTLLDTVPLPVGEGLHQISAADAMGWKTTLHENILTKSSREVLVTATAGGKLQTWAAKVINGRLAILELASVEAGVLEPSIIRASSLKMIAAVGKAGNELTIWDMRSSPFTRSEDFRQVWADDQVIQDLDWACTPDAQSILAVGFPHKVVLFCQQRWENLDTRESWVQFREIDMTRITPHPIGDSIWLDDGTLVVGAGNQLYVMDKSLKESHAALQTNSEVQILPGSDIFEAVSLLNGRLAVYHPQLIQQAFLTGKVALVHAILLRFLDNLQRHDREKGEYKPIPFLGFGIVEFTRRNDEGSLTKQVARSSMFLDDGPQEDGESLSILTPEKAAELNQLLTEVTIPYLSRYNQMRLAAIITCVAEIEQHRRSMDLNGARYYLFLKLHGLTKHERQEGDDVSMSTRDFLWAFHSTSQEILMDRTVRAYDNRISWADARESGMFLWCRSTDTLREKMEAIARTHYTQSDEKNPADCSLYYFALGKKNVMLGLWRSAGWHPESKAMLKLLANDFSSPRWKTVALKNAFALISKRRFEFAAAFFLLGDSLKDAVNICVRNLEDYQLAIAICRVYEGDNGPVLRDLLERHILPLAAEKGDRWLASWAFWMLKARDKAVRGLITPLETLIEIPGPMIKSDDAYADDPALVILYREIREKSLQTLKGASEIPPKLEFDFILHMAKTYNRMGCEVLALDLVKNWTFVSAALTLVKKQAEDVNVIRPGHLRRRSSVIADMPVKEITAKMKGLKAPPPTMFEEPDFSAFDF
ncbi:regulator of (H+)-ATPase in vacuolar membrane [Saitoella coloradoensis]